LIDMARLASAFARVSLVVAVSIIVACRAPETELPEPVVKFPAPGEATPPSGPLPAVPLSPRTLSTSERSAIEQLRRRGASITVFTYSGVLVHFPLGEMERRWRRDHTEPGHCGMGIEYEFTPDDSGPPMTDADMAYLERIPELRRVNLAGTQVTRRAIAAFRVAHPGVTVEETIDH
jgi:hypothetical protein